MPDLSGFTLGRYHLIELLGEGGMATVYKAYDTRLERDVAIKVIRTGAFPPLLIDMVSVGEQTGKIDVSLRRAAERYAKVAPDAGHVEHVVDAVIDRDEFAAFDDGSAVRHHLLHPRAAGADFR